MVSKPILVDHDFGSANRILNLLDGVAAQEPATVAQLSAAVEGIAWKDSVRVAASTDITISAPGATIDGVSMAASDRMLLRGQTLPEENGIYIWNGAATPATRAADMSLAPEFEQAVTTVEEGTDAGTSWRQTAVNVTVGTTAIPWVSFGTGASAASETTSGIAELATQGETDAGSDDARIVTPLKLKTSIWAKQKYSANFGDGAATSYAITHNIGTKDVHVEVYRNSGANETVDCRVERTSTTVVTLLFTTAPTSNQYRVVIIG